MEPSELSQGSVSSFRVDDGEIISTWGVLENGMLQDSSLSGTLFIITINDIFKRTEANDEKVGNLALVYSSLLTGTMKYKLQRAVRLQRTPKMCDFVFS